METPILLLKAFKGTCVCVHIYNYISIQYKCVCVYVNIGHLLKGFMQINIFSGHNLDGILNKKAQFTDGLCKSLQIYLTFLSFVNVNTVPGETTLWMLGFHQLWAWCQSWKQNCS